MGETITVFFRELQGNIVLTTAMLAWIVAQVSKTVISAVIDGRINFRRLVEPGGMPSAHSAFVTSLGTAIGLIDGWNSHTFALATVFALIVMYDAAGVRRAAGKQAQVLNLILDDLYKREIHPERLKELLGHTPVEVFAGALLGIFLALWRLGNLGEI